MPCRIQSIRYNHSIYLQLQKLPTHRPAHQRHPTVQPQPHSEYSVTFRSAFLVRLLIRLASLVEQNSTAVDPFRAFDRWMQHIDTTAVMENCDIMGWLRLACGIVSRTTAKTHAEIVSSGAILARLEECGRHRSKFSRFSIHAQPFQT